MTGGTSGIGRRALQRLLDEHPQWEVILLARPSSRIGEMMALPGAAGRLAIVNVDLASLASVNAACTERSNLLGPGGIDALVLNVACRWSAAILSSADGLESAFAVNSWPIF